MPSSERGKLPNKDVDTIGEVSSEKDQKDGVAWAEKYKKQIQKPKVNKATMSEYRDFDEAEIEINQGTT